MAKAPAKQQKSRGDLIPLDRVSEVLDVMQPKLRSSLPTHIPPERFVRVCMNTIQANPRLLECEPNSLYRAVANLAITGLEPDPAIGHASIVPRWSNKDGCLLAQPLVQYKGYIELARRSDEINSISCHLVYEKDTFNHTMGLDEKLEHIPAEGDRGDWIKVYSIARYRRPGGHHIEVMDKHGKEGVYAIRDRYSESYKAFMDKKISDSPWISAEGEMARKTCIRRASKYWPMSFQDRRRMDMAGTLDIAYERGASVQADPITGEVEYIGPVGDLDKLDKEAPASQAKSGRMLDHIAGEETAKDDKKQTPGTKAESKKQGTTKKTPPKSQAKEPQKESVANSDTSAEAETAKGPESGSLGPLTVYDTDGTMIGEHEDPSDYLQDLMNIIIQAPNRAAMFQANQETMSAILEARPDLQGSVDQLNEYRP